MQLRPPRSWLRVFGATLTLSLSTGVAQTQQAGPPQRVRPVMQAHKLRTAPVLDGDVLGDVAWRGASPASGFRQIRPNDGFPATQRTEVLVGYTAHSLYIGVVAHDTDPDRIVVTTGRRDSSLVDSDAFLVVIDGLLDRQNGFVFGTNPAGVQYDGQVTREAAGGGFGSGAGGFNLNWDATWEVKTRVADFGWSAEFDIPFKSLRYLERGEQQWGINFQRNVRRNNEIDFWSPLDRNRNLYRVSEAGTIRGIVPPAQRNLSITPYVLAKAKHGSEAAGADFHEELGADLKYSLTPSLTLDATYNTDFAQVEVDSQQVNLDRFNLFFPEKRPFFLENAGQFSVGNPEEVELFFSRRIGIGADGQRLPIRAGFRLSGKLGDTTNLGLIHMKAERVAGVTQRNAFSVLRVNQELPNRSSLGVLFVGREGEGTSQVREREDKNRTYAVDGRWGIGDNLMFSGWLGKTSTPRLRGHDHAFSLGGNYNSATWSSSARFSQVGANFNPEVGFLSRDSYRKISGFVMRRIRPTDLWGFLELRPHVSYRGFWDFEGFQETGFLHVDSHWEFKSGMELHTGVNFLRDGVKEAFEIVDGVAVQPNTYDHMETQLVFWTNRAAPLSASIRAKIGGRFGGDRVNLSPGLTYRAGDTFSSELTGTYNAYALPVPNGKFTAWLASARLAYSFTPKILLQLLVQYNDVDDILATNLRFSWLQSANAGLFVVYNEIQERGSGPPGRAREIIIKYGHIIDMFALWRAIPPCRRGSALRRSSLD